MTIPLSNSQVVDEAAVLSCLNSPCAHGNLYQWGNELSIRLACIGRCDHDIAKHSGNDLTEWWLSGVHRTCSCHSLSRCTLSLRGPKAFTGSALVTFDLALKWRRLKIRQSSSDFGFESEQYTARTMSSGVQRRRRMGSDTAIARDTTALYSSSQQQHVLDHRPGTTKFFEASGAERTTTAQTRCYRTSSYPPDTKHKFVHSGHSETTAETNCSSGGGAVCSDDSRTTADSTTSCSTSRQSNVIAVQLQMQALYSICPNTYFLDSADRLINLPDDLIKEVLDMLSVKEIVRMGCLNRSWRSEMRRFITDEQFNYS